MKRPFVRGISGGHCSRSRRRNRARTDGALVRARPQRRRPETRPTERNCMNLSAAGSVMAIRAQGGQGAGPRIGPEPDRPSRVHSLHPPADEVDAAVHRQGPQGLRPGGYPRLFEDCPEAARSGEHPSSERAGLNLKRAAAGAVLKCSPRLRPLTLVQLPDLVPPVELSKRQLVHDVARPAGGRVRNGHRPTRRRRRSTATLVFKGTSNTWDFKGPSQ